MNKISAVYKIVNTVTGDSYIGSSVNVKRRWQAHKWPSTWNNEPNKQLYLDMQKYGLDKFRFQILAPVMPKYLKQVEQEFIDLLHPAYNNFNAKGLNVERAKEYYIKSNRKSYRKYGHKLCSYNGEQLTLWTLAKRFRKAGIEHSYAEAKKYLINN